MAIGINWGEVWKPVWGAVWQTVYVPPVVEERRRGGHAWIHARKKAQRLALQHWWEYLTKEEPAAETKRVIREIKAGKPVPESKTPKGPDSISAEKLADKIIPSRLWEAQNIIAPSVDLQRVVANALRIAQEREDEELLLLL